MANDSDEEDDEEENPVPKRGRQKVFYGKF